MKPHLSVVVHGSLFLAVIATIAIKSSTTAAFRVPRDLHPSLASPRRSHRPSKSSCSPLYASYYIDIEESAPRDFASFNEWAENCGIQRLPAVDLTTYDGNDIFAITNDDISAGEAVMFVPSNTFLSSFGARNEFGQLHEAEALLGKLGGSDQVPLFYVFVKILYEYQKGETSPWFPWLNSLPRKYNNGASMTPTCYEFLPPLASKLAMEERVRLIHFNQALRVVDVIEENIKRNGDLTKWAFNVASTRGWEVQGERVIVPMADMVSASFCYVLFENPITLLNLLNVFPTHHLLTFIFSKFNHGTETEVEISYDENGNCVVYTTRDVPAGSPLRMSYGDSTNPSALFGE